MTNHDLLSARKNPEGGSRCFHSPVWDDEARARLGRYKTGYEILLIILKIILTKIMLLNLLTPPVFKLGRAVISTPKNRHVVSIFFFILLSFSHFKAGLMVTLVSH